MGSPEPSRQRLTLDANVFIAALRRGEPHQQDCASIIREIPKRYTLVEPSILYQEVCGTLARTVSLGAAESAASHLDGLLDVNFLTACDRAFCKSAYSLCSKYGIYATDALYLKVANESGAVLVSLDKKDLVDRVRRRDAGAQVFHVSEFRPRGATDGDPNQRG